MTGNQRETYRIEPEDFDAYLRWHGREHRCVIADLSAGGARVSCDAMPPVGTECELEVRPRASAPTTAAPSAEKHVVVVLESGNGAVRLRTREADAMSRLVFEAQRLERARATGAEAASPMVSDEQRRRDLRVEQRQRFSKGSLRPDSES